MTRTCYPKINGSPRSPIWLEEQNFVRANISIGDIRDDEGSVGQTKLFLLELVSISLWPAFPREVAEDPCPAVWNQPSEPPDLIDVA